MASLYPRATMRAVLSESSDFSNPIAEFIGKQYSAAGADYKVHHAIVNVPSSGHTIDLGLFSAVDAIFFVNRSAAYDVSARFTSWKAQVAYAAGELTFADANPDTIADSTSLFLAAGLFAKVGDTLVVSGTAAGANDGTFTIQAATANLLTLVVADALTAAAGVDGTLNLYRKNEVVSAYSTDGSCWQALQFSTGELLLSDDLVLTCLSPSQSAQVEVYILGT